MCMDDLKDFFINFVHFFMYLDDYSHNEQNQI